MKHPAPARKEGRVSVSITGDSLIVCRLAGRLSGDIVKRSVAQTKAYAQEIKARGQAPLLLIDVSEVTAQTSEARSRAKDLGHLGLKRVAVIGASRSLALVGKYIARVSGLGDSTRFFRTELLALRWLHASSESDRARLPAGFLLSVSLIILMSGAALLGWYMDNDILKAVIPSFKPMNPMTATTLLLLAVALCMIRGLAVRSARVKRPSWFISLVAYWALLFGALGLLQHFADIDTGVDTLLFGDQIGATQLLGRTSPGSALMFVLVGVMCLLVMTRLVRPWQRHLYYVCGYIVGTSAFVSIIGYAYDLERYRFFAEYISLPVSAAFAYMCLAYCLQTLTFRHKPAFYMRFYLKNWQAIIVVSILLFATGIIWQQARHEVRADSDQAAKELFLEAEDRVTSRLNAYTDALDGFRGLFAASEDVSPEEFSRYFVATALSERYPGFNAIVYTASVPHQQLSAFISQTRGRATEKYPEYGAYALFPINNNPQHYAILYTAPDGAVTSKGFDLSSEVNRRTALETARDTGKVVASDIINLNASRGSGYPDRPGFFVSLPVYAGAGVTAGAAPTTLADRRQQNTGFVIAYFETSLLFGDIFRPLGQNKARYVITDAITSRVLFDSKPKGEAKGDRLSLQRTDVFTIAGKQWRLSMHMPATLGVGGIQRHVPDGVLLLGWLLSGLVALFIFNQLRRRDQALQLAADMTEDLNNERNTAVAIQRKDEAILSSIGDAVFAIDTEQRITLFNPAAEKISGYEAAEVIGKPYKDILHFSYEKDGSPNDEFIQRALAGHLASMKNHTVLLRRDGVQVPVADSAAPIRDLQGTLLGVIVVFRDVSKEQALDKAKTEFVSLASHQLRTPLSAINWYAELLLGGDAGKTTKEQKQYLQEIYEGNQRMVELVNALLDVSRLDLGKLSNQPMPVALEEVITSLEKELSLSVAEKQLTITKHLSRIPPVEADPKLIRIIVQNLLSNAVKYTPQAGSVEVVLRPATVQDMERASLSGVAGKFVYMHVKDSGYGIPKAQQDKIFSKLFRADNVRALDVEGTGLGLYIVKEVIQKLGGSVWFESIESVGTTFYLVLPLHTRVIKLDTNS